MLSAAYLMIQGQEPQSPVSAVPQPAGGRRRAHRAEPARGLVRLQHRRQAGPHRGQAVTLSPATKDILGDLDDLLTIELFQSREPPAHVAVVARDVNDFLDDLAASSGGMVRIVRKYPNNNPEDEAGVASARKAQLMGVPQVQHNVQSQGELQIKPATWASR